MSRTSQNETQRTVSAKKQRARRKKQRLRRLLLLLAAVFLLGFLFGIFVGSKNKEVLNIIALPSIGKQEESNEELPWNLALVNFENELNQDFSPSEMTELTKDYFVDSRIADDARKMLDDAAADGIRVLCVSAYRSYERQEELFENKVKRLQKEKGYSIKEARAEAAIEVALPGTSEHQLGLALDLTDASYTGLDKKQEQTAACKWLSAHCQEYGFIVRYPADKTAITGIIYEPWHFRYVGREAAKEITEKGIVLEEYVGK